MLQKDGDEHKTHNPAQAEEGRTAFAGVVHGRADESGQGLLRRYLREASHAWAAPAPGVSFTSRYTRFYFCRRSFYKEIITWTCI